MCRRFSSVQEEITLPKKGFNQTVTGKIKDACLRLDTALRLRFEYNYRYPHEVDPLAASNSYAIIYVEILDFPEMTLSNWKIEKGRIALKGWFSAMLKLQQRNAEAIENGAGSITTECKGFDFSITLGDDFKIATDKETQKEIIEIKLQGS